MKTKLTTLILFTLLCLTACNNEDVTGRPVITNKYLTGEKGFCKFYYNGLGIRNAIFEDSCNKYSIGDTL